MECLARNGAAGNTKCGSHATCVQCTANADCPAMTPACSSSESCGACQDDNGCTGRTGTTHCTGGLCVQCTDPVQCMQGQVCRTWDNHTCCTPSANPCQGYECGFSDNGCGMDVNCGNCNPPFTSCNPDCRECLTSTQSCR
jgi:hypothetical protein